jgi:tetratricopeptide (TPR) repeat protein
LLSILFRDPAFLQPKYIHNLRQLPAAVTAKYGFSYAGLARPMIDAAIADTMETQAEAVPTASALGTSPQHVKAVERVGRLLVGQAHLDLVGDSQVQALQEALMKASEALDRYLDLAQVYGQSGAYAAALEVLAAAMDVDPTRLLLEPRLIVDPTVQNSTVLNENRMPRWSAAELLPAQLPADEGTRLWLRGYLEIKAGRFAEAVLVLQSALQSVQKLATRSATISSQAKEIVNFPPPFSRTSVSFSSSVSTEK